MKKSILALVLVAVLCLSIVVSASADRFVYSFDADDEKYIIISAINLDRIASGDATVNDMLYISKEYKFTGKPISPHIQEVGGNRWSLLYDNGKGICPPPKVEDIYYEYPDGKDYKEPPIKAGKYKAKIDVGGITVVREFEILEPKTSKLNMIRDLLQEREKN